MRRNVEKPLKSTNPARTAQKEYPAKIAKVWLPNRPMKDLVLAAAFSGSESAKSTFPGGKQSGKRPIQGQPDCVFFLALRSAALLARDAVRGVRGVATGGLPETDLNNRKTFAGHVIED